MTTAAPPPITSPPDLAENPLADAAARRRRRVPYLLLLPGMLWLAFFFLVPLVQLVITSLQEGSLESGYDFAWAWENYATLFTTYRDHFLRSMLYAGIATILGLLIGYPLAYTIAFRTGRFKNLFLVLLLMPFLVPFLLRTLAWRIILADEGAVVTALQTVGILPSQGRLLATPVAVVAGLTYNLLPFMVLPIYVALEKLDRAILEASADLYGTPFVSFWQVTWPLSLPGVISGTLLTFIPAAGDYVEVELLGSPQSAMVGNVIENKFLNVIDYPAAASLSVGLMAVVVLLVIFYIRSVGTEELVT
jgi:spermidine/putrescine transport system permease protein